MYRFLLILFLSLPAYGGGELSDIIRKNSEFINNFAADSIYSLFTGPGVTEVEMRGIENKKPEFSVLLVRPLKLTETNALFSQLSLNHYYVRNDERITINIGVGYRKVFDGNYIIGGNVFLDADDEDNTRSSFGLELKSNAFEAYVNYYLALSSANKVGTNTERVLDGYDFHALGQIPFFPWAKIHYSYFDWDAEKYSQDTDGTDLSLEMLITKNILLEVGYTDNNISSADSFGSVRLIYPGKAGVSMFDEFISEEAFVTAPVNYLLLSKVERQNRIILETVSQGVVIGRLD